MLRQLKLSKEGDEERHYLQSCLDGCGGWGDQGHQVELTSLAHLIVVILILIVVLVNNSFLICLKVKLMCKHLKYIFTFPINLNQIEIQWVNLSLNMEWGIYSKSNSNTSPRQSLTQSRQPRSDSAVSLSVTVTQTHSRVTQWLTEMGDPVTSVTLSVWVSGVSHSRSVTVSEYSLEPWKLELNIARD